MYCSGCISSSSYLVYVGLVEDFDLSEPDQKGHSGVDQEIEESALRVAAKGKRTRARSGKDNSGSESKQAGLSRRTRNKPTLTISSCGKVETVADDPPCKIARAETRPLRAKARHPRRGQNNAISAIWRARVRHSRDAR